MFRNRTLFACCGVLLVCACAGAGGCTRPSRVEPGRRESPRAGDRGSEPVQVVEPPEPGAAIDVVPPTDDSSRWLLVEEYKDRALTGRATGEFHRDRNKIEIHTRNVWQFTIDTSRIPVEWDRLVIIGIDGINTELKRRDHPRLRFRLDAQAQWAVVEPK
ncbi:MAG: hypothetical protein AABZ12_04640 [Planctomycetota bacterium]